MSADTMPPLPLVPGAVLGLYGEDGVCLVQRGTEDGQIARKGGHRLVTEAAARAYAAEQTRELVEALESVTEILDMALMVGIPTLPPDADGPAVSARALIAKHKGQA